MIVIDTSALMAILFEEADGRPCRDVLVSTPDLAMSAGTLAEALIVADRRGVRGEVERMVRGLGVDVIPVTAAFAGRVADAYARWGKGVHKAGLNYGDCFAYALASELGCPLLFVGNDFAQTDVRLAIGGG